MPPIPLALLPCCVLLRVTALLIPPAHRGGWTDEWLAEAWAHYTQERGLWRMYRAVAGCIQDAWWHFVDDSSGKRRFLESLRSPGFCLLCLLVLFGGCILASGFLPATTAILEPLPYGGGQNRIAVVSRAGRLEAVRRGVPGFLAADWKKHSTRIESLALCLLPRKTTFAAGGKTTEALRLAGTPNLFQVLGVKLPDRGPDTHSLWISANFWKREFHANPQIAGQIALVNGARVVIAGVLPHEFWFLSPAIDVFELDNATFAAQGVVVVRSKPDVSAQALEADLIKIAADEGYEFARTAPHAIFLRQAMETPLWLFGSALFIAGVLVTLAYGSRWMHVDEAGDLLPRRHWRWWGFFAAKTTMALVIVLVLGIELFVGRSQQAISGALGGPALIWFYITGCSFVLFTSISDQRSRCRVCQRLLASPIRIGCPGCLLLDWAGTEFLCPQGHGVLYVPHHVACWEEEDRWVLLEV
jgi:hypothetical protein